MPRKTKKTTKDILDLYNSVNIAESLTDEEKAKIAELVIDEFEEDAASSGEFDSTIKLAMDIAKQVMSEKSTPWEGASNMKYPLITSAALQSAARMYPEVVRNGRVAEAKVLGQDPDGQGEQKAKRVSEHLNYQLLIESEEWEPDLDRLLHVLPIVGTVFKKTFWDELQKKIRSVMCQPAEIVVNRNIKSLETARRVTHVMPMHVNDIISGIRFGLFCDISDDIHATLDDDELALHPMKDQVTGDKDQQLVLEQHRFLDLDHDGYEEPYIVTVHKDTKKLLRIYRRFDLQDVHINPKTSEIWKIDPCCYFTDYHYIPSPDGSFYSIGFGQILYPLNETINTLFNQLVDAGTLSNRQSGFLGKGFKSRSGSVNITPGQWEKIDSTGDDIRKNVFPMPIRDPSPVLFQLLGLMIQTGKELTSSTDILQGQQPAQNAPATTVLSLIEQGLKVHSAILKRFDRAIGKELKKIVRLNGLYLEDTNEYEQVLSTGVIFKDDYDLLSIKVVPVSDPAMGSDAQRLARANALLQLLPMLQGSGQQAALTIYLDSLQMPQGQIQSIIPPTNPNQPSPQAQEAQVKQQELAHKANDAMMKHQLQAEKIQVQDNQTKVNQLTAQIQLLEAQARIQKMNSDTELSKAQMALEAAKVQHDNSSDVVNSLIKMKQVSNQHEVGMAQVESQRQAMQPDTSEPSE